MCTIQDLCEIAGQRRFPQASNSLPAIGFVAIYEGREDRRDFADLQIEKEVRRPMPNRILKWASITVTLMSCHGRISSHDHTERLWPTCRTESRNKLRSI